MDDKNANVMRYPIDKQSVDIFLFERLERLIIEKQKFRVPRLTRQYLIRETGIPKNKFAKLFVKFRNKTFTDYLNDLRLDYAAAQLVIHPEYTVEAIAQDSGLPKTQTFYRLFNQKFGTTPAQYRRDKTKQKQ